MNWRSSLTEFSSNTSLSIRVILAVLLIVMALILARSLIVKIRKTYATGRSVKIEDVLWWVFGAVVSVFTICEGLVYIFAIILL